MIEIFKNKKIKLTNQRKLIYDIIEKENEPTKKLIYDKCKGIMDKSTTYRIIDLFVENKIINQEVDYEGYIYYKINTNEHIHYIDCIKCHKQIKIDYCPILEMEKHINNLGYKLINHEIKFNVICDECLKK